MKIVELLEWDSNYFGFPVAQIQSRTLSQNHLDEVLHFCKKYDVRLLQFKCDAHHRESIILAEQGKFHFVDVRLTLSQKLFKSNEFTINMPPDLIFRKGEISDIPALKSIVTDLYTQSRYYFDTNFPRNDVHGFYQNWIEKSVHGNFDDLVYVLCQNDIPIGCCSVLYKTNEIASIGLFGIDPSFGGKGFGKILIDKVLLSLSNEGIKTVSVATQGRNYIAQKLYQSAGFCNEKMEIYYHKWFLGSDKD